LSGERDFSEAKPLQRRFESIHKLTLFVLKLSQLSADLGHMTSAISVMKRQFVLTVACLSLLCVTANAKGPYYGGGKHTTSHGGKYTGAKGSSHKGGHYTNPRTGNQYGSHKPPG
jgi:hypothetical protein